MTMTLTEKWAPQIPASRNNSPDESTKTSRVTLVGSPSHRSLPHFNILPSSDHSLLTYAMPCARKLHSRTFREREKRLLAYPNMKKKTQVDTMFLGAVGGGADKT